MSKKRILAFNDYYIPAVKCGGPVTSVSNAVKSLSDDFEFYIESANHDFGDKTPFPNIEDKWYEVGKAHVRYHNDGELDFKYAKIKEFIEEVKPDLMWFSGLLVPNKLHNAIFIGEKLNIPVLISPRGEASEDRMALKAYKKKPYAALVSLMGIYKKKNVYFHVTSDDETKGLVRFFHINPDKITEVPNIGVTISKRESNYRKEIGNVRAMFISRIHEVKNLHFAIKAFSQLKCEAEFDIYGPIESPAYWAQCEELIKQAPGNISINYCGKINPTEVREVYQKYDCFLFPTINENYGHVIAEALANGCPVVLSRGTTPWDDIDGKAGMVCDLDNINSFSDALSKIALMDGDKFQELVDSTYNYYEAKTNDSDAVLGHKKMFSNIIEEWSNEQ